MTVVMVRQVRAIVELRLQIRLSASLCLRKLAAGSRLGSRGIPFSFYTEGGCGGKSGLHRAECQVTPGGREPTESAAENTPPMASVFEPGHR